MNREQALPYVAYALDDALNPYGPETVRLIARGGAADPSMRMARLIGWQCGFEPMFVAVFSYLPSTRLDEQDAVDIASDYLEEIGWFADEPTEPDYVL